jgi:hypothetical protein
MVSIWSRRSWESSPRNSSRSRGLRRSEDRIPARVPAYLAALPVTQAGRARSHRAVCLYSAASWTYACWVSSSSQPGAPVADPDVAAAVRLLHRRQGWGRMTVTCFIAFVLAAGASASAQSQGAAAPSWFQVMIIVLGALTIVGIVAAVADTAGLRRRPPGVRAQAVPLAARHPSRPHAHHYPPRHRVTWALRWVGLLLILVVAVVSLPGVVDGVAYLAGAGDTVTFDPVSYQTSCDQYGCQKSTDGILETGGTGIQAAWPDVVPLGRPFQVREPVWRWGLGAALIDSDGIAVGAVLISLLIQGAAVLVMVRLVKLARTWVLHRRQRTAPAPVSIPWP